MECGQWVLLSSHRAKPGLPCVSVAVIHERTSRDSAAMLKHAGLWEQALGVVSQLRSGKAAASIAMSREIDEIVGLLHKFRRHVRDEQIAIKSAGALLVCLCCAMVLDMNSVLVRYVQVTLGLRMTAKQAKLWRARWEMRQTSLVRAVEGSCGLSLCGVRFC